MSIPAYGAIDLAALAAARQAQEQSEQRAAARAADPNALPVVVDVTDQTFQADVLDVSLQVPVVLDLWATWCGPCLKEMPELQAFADEQGANGIQVAGIALDDAAAVAAFLRDHAIGYPSLVDTPGPADAGVRLGNPAGVLPYSLLVSAEGRILKTRIGPFADKADIAAWAQRD